jgi:hypothetical protein
MDREEFFRLKKIQSKKKRDTAVKEQEDKLKREKEEAEYEAKYADTGEREKKQDEEVGMDLLQEKDEDGAFFSLFLCACPLLSPHPLTDACRAQLTTLLHSHFLSALPFQSSNLFAQSFPRNPTYFRFRLQPEISI